MEKTYQARNRFIRRNHCMDGTTHPTVDRVHAIRIAYRKQNGEFYMARGTLIYYESDFHRKYDIERIKNHVAYWDIEQQGWRTFQIENFLEWRPIV